MVYNYLLLFRVQESDGSFFESFTALCWKQENRRLQILREEEHYIYDIQQNKSSSDESSQVEVNTSMKEVRSIMTLYTLRTLLLIFDLLFDHIR